jgi:hypothetical protein
MADLPGFKRVIQAEATDVGVGADPLNPRQVFGCFLVGWWERREKRKD